MKSKTRCPVCKGKIPVTSNIYVKGERVCSTKCFDKKRLNQKLPKSWLDSYLK
jgi:hypothetical protein